MVENVRSGGQVVLSSGQLFGQTNSIGFGEFASRNRLDGMSEIELEDRTTIVFPSGGVLLKTNGSLFGPPEEPVLLATWKLRHAIAWEKLKVQEFHTAKAWAQQDPTQDWIPHLKEKKAVAKHARANLIACKAALEEAQDPGGVQRAAQKQMTEEYNRERRASEAFRSRKLAEVLEITLDDVPSESDDE
jgi:hypothetical protein